MKLRNILPFLILALLSGCNYTLAADITPPPGYIAPTPVPTLVLFPPETPNVQNGAAIYAEKCEACHGVTGLGDGEQGIQLGVTVRAFGLPEIARPASPAQYFTAVTRGNIERFMPPFASLNDQERWDVTAYVLTLHTTPEEVERGRQLFETHCKDCPADYFKDPQRMAALTEVELARIASKGNDTIPAFGAGFNEDDLWAIAVYLRSLSFDNSPLSTPEPAAAIVTPVSPEATPGGTDSAPAESEATAIPQPGYGTVHGSLENKTGAALPSDLTITLRGFEHDLTNPSAGPAEVISLDGVVNPDGTYAFTEVELPANRIFVAQVDYQGVKLQSGFAVAEEGVQDVVIPVLVLYEITDDTSILTMEDVQLIFDAGDQTIQVLSLYSFVNTSEKMLVIEQSPDGDLPFIRFPEGSFNQGFEPTQDSAKFIAAANGIAIPPSETPYGLIAVASLPKNDSLEFSQFFALPVPVIRVFLPEGMSMEGSRLTDLGQQTIQSLVYRMYEANGVASGETVTFTVSGSAQGVGSTAPVNTGLLVGAIALGVSLIAAGLWMYRREKSPVAEEQVGVGLESTNDVVDAIIALDDLHGKKKISEQAYKKRRAELKQKLKELMS